MSSAKTRRERRAVAAELRQSRKAAPRPKKQSKKTTLEDKLASQIAEANLPEPVREERFHPTRKWRFDFAWPALKVAAEVEGGIWSNGRHIQPAGFEADCEKYGHAVAMGWAVIRVTGRMIKNMLGIDLITETLKMREELHAT